MRKRGTHMAGEVLLGNPENNGGGRVSNAKVIMLRFPEAGFSIWISSAGKGWGQKVLSKYFLNYQLKINIPKGSLRVAKLGQSPSLHQSFDWSSYSPPYIPKRVPFRPIVLWTKTIFKTQFESLFLHSYSYNTTENVQVWGSWPAHLNLHQADVFFLVIRIKKWIKY